MKSRKFAEPDRPGDFAPRPLRKDESFDLKRALEQRTNAVDLWEGFEEFGTSINAIESIIAADRATLFPLPGAHAWLVQCLERWHRAEGKITMDQAMGLAPTYKGGELDAVRAARLRRDRLTAEHMARLVALGFSDRAASGLVASAIQRSQHPAISAATIARGWPRMKRENGTLALHATMARQMSDLERIEYLRQFGSPKVPTRKRGELKGISRRRK